MAATGQQQTAMTNRSIRTIRNELEYLSDTGVLSPQQMSSILAQIPSQAAPNASFLNPPPASAQPTIQLPSPAPSAAAPFNEKQPDYYAPTISPAIPPPAYPPAYPPTPTPAPVAVASALYEYKPADAGDLAFLPYDRIAVTEFMNADWAKGRNERTGLEGIFPRSYVRIVEEHGISSAPPQPPPTNYGNLPLQVSQGGGEAVDASGGKESKLAQGGKKFGKKLGNAAIFGAGATVGSNIVNGIF